MADQTADFFEALRGQARDPLLEQAEGTLRFVLADDGGVDHWFVSIADGELAVSHARRKADCTIRATKKVFDGVVGGEVNATAAVLRGALVVEGDPELLTLFQRLFPGPPEKDET